MAGPKTKTPRKATKQKERNLTAELARFLDKTLLPDLQSRAKEPSVRHALEHQFQVERTRRRTADSFEEWTTRTLEQVGVAWILSCVFIRTLEDRGYLTHARLAGDGAADSEHLFLDLFPSLTIRDYLLATFRELSHLPGGEEVLGPHHNPAWRLSPSVDAVRELVASFREVGAAGKLTWSFGGTITRFLGDLYQDISVSVRERYALLQTPEFVEEFILDLTLDPAIKEYGLEEVRLIDPTCGSGHFLLGAFRRLFEARQRKAPALPAKEHAGRALAQVFGVDLNPYAAAIARFRLVLAYLQAAQIDKLKDAPRISLNVVAADSLLFGAREQTIPIGALTDDAAAWGDALFQLEDPGEAQRVFAQTFHAVVGNPPYITCKDAALRDQYRAAYKSAMKQFALAAPFTERFFQLAADGGFVGMINSNSFMKREFGKKLIEEVLSRVDLTRVIDTAGAYIPGHGTPTVLLFGRNRAPIASVVPAVLGKRGEPVTPSDPESGLVWSSIRDHFADGGFENDFISVAEMRRETLGKHPWSLGGGGASELKQWLEDTVEGRLSDIVANIGRTTVVGEDDVWIAAAGTWSRFGIGDIAIPLVIGESVRDWSIHAPPEVIYPYDRLGGEVLPSTHRVTAVLWPWRALLERRTVFGKEIKACGRRWWEHLEHYTDKLRTQLSITFAFVATHNHFVLVRGGKVFKQTAPIIKLSASATEDDHLALLAYLNSSTACFWMKQVSMNKGATSDRGVLQADPEKFRFEFDATKLSALPTPHGLPAFRGGVLIEVSRLLCAAAESLCVSRFETLLLETRPTALSSALERQLASNVRLRRQMITWQEELDWLVYELMGLLREFPDAVANHSSTEYAAIEGIDPDERPFRGKTNGPRAAAIRQSATLMLLEDGKFKRRWFRAAGAFDAENVSDEMLLLRAATAVATRVVGNAIASLATPAALRTILRSVAQDAALENCCSALKTEFSEEFVAGLLDAQAVPYLCAARLVDTGIEKRNRWETVWLLQRREDAGEKVEVTVPPKYDPKDYRDPVFWRLRGRLDVPHEHFISYPGAEKDDDPSPLYGWAGWDHLQQAMALGALYHERKNDDGWSATETGREKLVPLLAGLLELVPWLKQWHNAANEELGGEGAGDWYGRYVEAEARSIGRSIDDLRAWRPQKGGKGKPGAKSKKAKSPAGTDEAAEASEA